MNKKILSKSLVIGMIFLFFGLIAVLIEASYISGYIKDDSYDNIDFGWGVFIGRIKNYEETETYISFYIVNGFYFGWDTINNGFVWAHIYDFPVDYKKEYTTTRGIITNNFMFVLMTYIDGVRDYLKKISNKLCGVF